MDNKIIHLGEIHFLSRHGSYEAEIVEEEKPDIVMHEALNEEERDEAGFRLENFRRYGDLERASNYFEESYGASLSFPNHDLEEPVYNFSKSKTEDVINYLEEKLSKRGLEAEIDRMKFFLEGNSRTAPLSFGLRSYDKFMYDISVSAPGQEIRGIPGFDRGSSVLKNAYSAERSCKMGQSILEEAEENSVIAITGLGHMLPRDPVHEVLKNASSDYETRHLGL